MVSNSNALNRIEFFNLLSHYKKVDSGGRYLNNINANIEDGTEPKLAWMRKYKFSICFENSSYPGYTTEKLMHALISDTIPIYWGNPDAHLDFNQNAFINCHKYKSWDEVIELVREIDNDEKLYQEYLSQPRLPNGEETEFCKEENIAARLEEIFANSREYVPENPKKNFNVVCTCHFGNHKGISEN